MFNKWGQNAVIPIYTHIPQYPEITGYFFIPSYNRMVPLLTIITRFINFKHHYYFGPIMIEWIKANKIITTIRNKTQVLTNGKE